MSERYEVVYDDFADSPYDECMSSIFVSAHRRYELGNVNLRDSYEVAEYEQEHKDDIEWSKKHGLYSNVFLMDHSGLTLSRSAFPGMYGYFDSGQVGFIYVSREVLKKYNITRMGSKVKEVLHKVLDWEFECIKNYVEGNTYILFDNEKGVGQLCGTYEECM